MSTKCGYVTIIGRPNAGKSTLMNVLLGERLSIITSKPQTTRKRILGILDKPEYQIIFLDTPGILNPEYLLQEKMLDHVFLSVKDADVLLFMIDISDDPTGSLSFDNESVQKIMKTQKCKKILLINKIDLSNEATVNKLMEKFREEKQFDEVIPISAMQNFNIEKVVDVITANIPEYPKLYPEDQLTDQPERFFVSEIIREKIFELYREEVPYSCEVMIEDFKERESGKDYISASIIVERDSQKPIIIGKNAEMIKKLGQISRQAVEEFLQRSVYLELNVKVKPKWRSNPQMLKNFGYSLDND
ncbi:MAG: GTPase Era [bacterium]